MRLPQGNKTQRSFSGSGSDEDIVVSSARAYVSALNKMISYISAIGQTPSSASSIGSANEAIAAK